MDEQPTPITPITPAPAPAQPPVDPTKKPMSLILKFMIGCGVLAFILLFLVIIAIIVINPVDKFEEAQESLEIAATSSATKDETAGWKTYRSDVGKFEIKYPESMALEEGGAGFTAYVRIGEGVPDATVIVSVDQNENNQITNYTNVKVDNLNAKLTKSSDLADSKSYYIEKNNMFYRIELSRTKDEDEELLNSILLTFKFI